MQNNMTLAECMGLIESKTGYKVYSKPNGYVSGSFWNATLYGLFADIFGVTPDNYQL